eukprot:gb/GECG01006841.1/.p1 GENE.gb/GECG01006841.1/~~gb/GECG01006841.1/.p1  ORF type:complete len:859 (+),score=100.56 gb/GECG01006841.1/:1-2577(+)
MMQRDAGDSIPQALFKNARQNGNLKLANREITRLPPSAWKLHQEVTENERWWDNVDLRGIDLTNNKLEFVPEETCDPEQESAWMSVESIRLSNNKLRSLPEGIGNLEFLVSLYVDKNHLQSVPFSLTACHSLRTLDLSENSLTSVPEELCQLRNLENLYLNRNRLERLPEDIGSLSNLLELKISENRLVELPRGIGNLDKIKTLDIHDNRISELPQSVSMLHNVETLDARRNRLHSIPVLPQTHSLHSIFLGENRLQGISSENLKQCPNLSIVDLSDNRIKELDTGFGKLFGLVTLDLRNNDLSSLPYTLGFVHSLNKIALDGNPLRTIRRSVWSAGAEELKKYLRSRAPEDLAHQLEEEAAAASAELRKAGQIAKRAGNHAGSNLGPRGYIGQSRGIYRNQDGGAFDFVEDVRSAKSTGGLDLHNRKLKHIPTELWSELSDAFKANEDIAPNAFFDRFESQGAEKQAEGNRLQTIDLSGNLLTSSSSLPEGPLAVFQDVTRCLLSRNRFATIPDPVLQMENLRELDLSHNDLTNDAVEKALSVAVDMEPSILKTLRYLDLSHNRLERVPKGLEQFMSLNGVNLSNNRVKEDQTAEDALSVLTLRSIDLSCNRLENVPRAVLILPRLEELHLDNNNLKAIPPQLGAIASLHTLGIQGNAQKAIPQHTVLSGTQAVLKSLSRRIDPEERRQIQQTREHCENQLREVEEYERSVLEEERKRQADLEYERSIAPKIGSGRREAESSVDSNSRPPPSHSEGNPPVENIESRYYAHHNEGSKPSGHPIRQPFDERGTNSSASQAPPSRYTAQDLEQLRSDMQELEMKLEKGGMTSRREQQLKRDLTRRRAQLVQAQNQVGLGP